jgi:hypothetical protein
MSVTRIVASMRSPPVEGRDPVRNSSISSRIKSAFPMNGK